MILQFLLSYSFHASFKNYLTIINDDSEIIFNCLQQNKIKYHFCCVVSSVFFQFLHRKLFYPKLKYFIRSDPKKFHLLLLIIYGIHIIKEEINNELYCKYHY